MILSLYEIEWLKRASKNLPERKKVETEINELSKKTLGSYVKKAATDLEYKGFERKDIKGYENQRKSRKGIDKRLKGIHKAANKLSKEETETKTSFKKYLEEGVFRPSFHGHNTGEDDGKKYKVIRFHKNGSPKTIKRGLTLGQARSHSSHPETSSSTAKERAGKDYIKRHGEWFDGYDLDRK